MNRICLAIAACLSLLSAHARGAVFDLYIAAGQSNMDGRGKRAELAGDLSSFKNPQREVLLWYDRPVDPSVAPTGRSFHSDWVPLAPGYSVPPLFTGELPSSTFGPEVSFGKSLAETSPDRRLAIVKVARGGTNLLSDWDPSAAPVNGPKGYMYAGFETTIHEAIEALNALGHSVEVRGVLWHQGESDEGQGQAAYEANLTELIRVVRDDLGYPNLPFVIGELESVDSGREGVRTAQANVAAAVRFAEFVPSTGLLLYDGAHFTAASQIELGQRFAATMQATVSTISGDYNRDGVVDAADHAVWRTHFGSVKDARADGNNDGKVDAADYTIWRDHQGASTGNPLRGARANLVPEQGSSVSTALVLSSCGACFWWRAAQAHSLLGRNLRARLAAR